MKHLIFLVITGLAAHAWAQAPAKEAAKPEPAKEAAKPEAAEPQPAKHAVVIPKKRRWHEDARHCLERPTNTDIIKCAEEYL
ncbi:MAG TPA: signal peptidase [Burkholderiales bacterium]|nr:signal peptidase [Burkholderiales bacterium]